MWPVKDFGAHGTKELRENRKSHQISPLVTIFIDILITHTHILHIHVPHNMELWAIFFIVSLTIGCGKPLFRFA